MTQPLRRPLQLCASDETIRRVIAEYQRICRGPVEDFNRLMWLPALAEALDALAEEHQT